MNLKFLAGVYKKRTDFFWVLIFIFYGLFLCNLRAIVLDWDSFQWSSGTLEKSFDIDSTNPGNDIKIILTPQNTYNQSFLTSTKYDGGTGGKSLQMDLFIDQSGSLTVTVEFNYAQGVKDVNFSLYDVDKGTVEVWDYTDKIISIAASSSSSPVIYPSKVVGSSANEVSGSGATLEVTGTQASPNNSANGNVNIQFSDQPINKLWFKLVAPDADGSYYGIGLSDMSFNPVPEPQVANLAVILCVGFGVFWLCKNGKIKKIAGLFVLLMTVFFIDQFSTNAGLVLDWDNFSWKGSGNAEREFDLDNDSINDIKVMITSTANRNRYATATTYSTENSLAISPAFTDSSQYVGIGFYFLNAKGANNISFTLYDIDAGNNTFDFIDRVASIQGLDLNGNAVAASSVVGDSYNKVEGSGLDIAVQGVAQNDEKDKGIVSIKFDNIPLKEVSFVFKPAGENALYGMAVGDISFNPVPEPISGLVLGVLCLIFGGYYIKRKATVL